MDHSPLLGHKANKANYLNPNPQNLYYKLYFYSTNGERSTYDSFRQSSLERNMQTSGIDSINEPMEQIQYDKDLEDDPNWVLNWLRDHENKYPRKRLLPSVGVRALILRL
jgi:hypothetical protein